MSLSVATMGLAELAEFLVANGAYTSVAEAMAALNIVIVDGVGAAGTALAVTGGAAQTAIGTVGQTALDLAAQAQLQATGTGVTTAGIGLLQGETATGAAALLGLDVGVVAAGAAPILGVALGAQMYKSNPELWTKISQKLLPFCYPGTTKIPTWAEIAETRWKTSVAKEVIDALKELFDDENIPYEGKPASYGTATYEGVSWPYALLEGTTWRRYGYTYTATNVESEAYCVSEEGRLGPRVITPEYPEQGRVYYTEVRSDGQTNRTWFNVNYDSFSTASIGGSTYSDCSAPIVPEGTLSRVARALKFGTKVPAVPGEYQEGTSKWQGTTPTEIPQSKPAVIGIDSTTGDPITQPMVPISPPITAPEIEPEPQPKPEVEPTEIPFPWPEPRVEPHTRPWPTEMPWPLPEEQPEWWPVEIPYPYKYPKQYPSPDPEVQPDPETLTEPETQVQPYILPKPLPYELPYPYPYPQSDPERDPTKPTPPTIEVDPYPLIPLGPEPIGISPTPSMPSTPIAFSQGGGLVTVYHPTPAELYSFEQWLWVTYADATIDKIFNNPFDGVITLFELYCTPTDVGSQTIKSGFLDSGINSAVISRYTQIDCGTIGIPEYYGNYLDYSPYSKAHVYLPFIGIVELNVDDIVGHAVNITYRIDEYNGACIAMITVAKVTEVNGEQVEYSNTMYQFSGNCSVELPLAGGTQAAIKAGMMQADAYQTAATISAGASIVGGLGSLLLGSIGGAISGIGQAASSYAYGQASALSHMLSGKSTVQKSGSFGASHGALGIKTPFIVVTRPKQIQVPNYNELYGYPAHKMVYVGDCTGFLRCREVHVVSATASNEEKVLIEQLMKTGVYVTE